MCVENNLFPVFLKLEELHTLIIGGGYVGTEKITAVLSNSPNARITLVAPEINNSIIRLSKNCKNVALVYRKFIDEDVLGKDIVIVATNDKPENERIWQVAKKNKVLCNVADTPKLCDFYLSSVVQKGNLKIAVSTNGKSPTIAKRIKEVLQESFPDNLEQVMENLNKIREGLQGDFSEKVKKLNEITSVLSGSVPSKK